MRASGRVVIFLSLLSLIACRRESERPLFELLSSSRTGITFANTVTTDDSLNVQTYSYVYNGGGVAVGDVNNDGLPDLFFSGNMVSSRLYVNKGGMRFEDITEQAGVTTRQWATGASMVDINNDGHLDIYVSVSGPEWSTPAERANLLFVNDGDGTFTEAAARYRVADGGFTTHAIFLDYDRDGCLDLFLLNNSPQDFARGVAEHPSGMHDDTPNSYNELYRNDCPGGKAGTFTNVSKAAGILRDVGYGLGAVAADLNRDGWTDIYVSNDGPPNDVVYVNQGNGTFVDKAGQWLKHTSAAGMGIDVADFNDDGWPDILQVDMMPRELNRRKTMSGFATYRSMVEWRRRGFRYDYTLNTLQLSNGITREGELIFSEIARRAGVAYTGWSWSALFADFDNDGRKDIFVSNGYPKAVIDLDYQNAILSLARRGDAASRRAARALLATLPAYKEVNVIFRNRGDLTFADMSEAGGMGPSSFSYGAAYADLDNDGRLDLVVNNLDAPPFIYHNVAPTDEAHHYLQVRLEGQSSHSAIGSTLIITAGGHKQYVYYTPYRGFMSTMDDRVHFGLGRARRLDSLEVHWPDGRYQLMTGVDADRLVVVKQADATGTDGDPTTTAVRGANGAANRFELVASPQGLQYGHHVGAVFDYGVQPLLPYLISRQGPPLAVGDVNGDGLDDVFVGGASRVPGRLFLQRRAGGFTESNQGQPWVSDTTHDDWGALFFDANGDKLPDLYVASGGYHLAPTSALLQDRLYINKGGGSFSKDSMALPPMLTSTATVRAADFNADGRVDLFVGGRLTPRRYPYPTRSYILRNDGGRFTDVTDAVAPELVSPGGMVTDATWVDFDGDGRVDLITVGEWMSVQFFRNDGARLRNVTEATRLPPSRGWWYSLAAADFDGDGRTDLVAGNLGLNYTYTTSRDSTFGVYAGRFTSNQTTDVVLTQRLGATEYPLAGMLPLGREVYPTGLKFPTYGSFARASMRELFGSEPLKQALHYEVDTFASVYLRNTGEGTFSMEALPSVAQISPIRGIIADDVDGDGHRDLLVAGNLYDAEPNTPRADAGNGMWLRGDGKGHFAPVPPAESGFLAPLNVAGLALVRTAAGKMVLVANTGDSLQAFRVR